MFLVQQLKSKETLGVTYQLLQLTTDELSEEAVCVLYPNPTSTEPDVFNSSNTINNQVPEQLSPHTEAVSLGIIHPFKVDCKNISMPYIVLRLIYWRELCE